MNEEQLALWLAHPVTQAFAAHINRVREEIKETWARGDFVDDTEFKTAVKEAAAHRHCEVLRTLLDLDAGDLSHEE